MRFGEDVCTLAGMELAEGFARQGPLVVGPDPRSQVPLPGAWPYVDMLVVESLDLGQPCCLCVAGYVGVSLFALGRAA